MELLLGGKMKTLAILVLLGYSFQSQSFTLNNNVGARFAQNEIAINVSANSASTCATVGLGTADILDLAQEAANRFWNTVSTSRIKLVKGTEVSVSSNFETGKLCESVINGDICEGAATDIPKVNSGIVIACNTNTAYEGVLGVSLPNNINGNSIVGSAILIYTGSGETFSSKNRDEKISIIAHEIGHALGLGHSPSEHALMYWRSMANKFYLARDDVKGLTYLYPKKDKFLGISSCGTISFNQPPGGGGLKLSLLSFLVGLILFASFPIRRSKSLK